MIIKLSPVRSDLVLGVLKSGDTLAINGKAYDLSRLADGASLPVEAIGDEFVAAPIERVGGNLVVTLTLPHAADAPEQARFPVDIVNPADGPVPLPGLEASEQQAVAGVIDWSQVITAEMKAEAATAHLLATISAEVSQRRVSADAAIAPLQDAVDLDMATDQEVALLKDWKRYRVALNRLPEQEGYPSAIDWPAPPA
ncbi:tail fiber assembly protein [Pseudomonas sp. PCH44]|uniref:tail fiber assembly protein n=1 Tax=Pseudomonas sp. PCH44 TaxID=2800904 RepID=UPI0024B54C68|nr:tail fiber assembly protein [Pseudomonas sp. PCH44]